MNKYRLLVIEDEEKIADLVCRVARELGFDTCAVHKSAEIAARLDSFVPHVVVLDVMMPSMDSFEVLKLMRQHNSASRVLVLSGNNEYRTMACRMGEGLDLMVYGSIAKPFRLPELRLGLREIKASLGDITADEAA